jgi:ubiquinone/menaquinone biosynthesis C-methylase UbiE
MNLTSSSNEDELTKRIDVQKACTIETEKASEYNYLYNSTNVHPRNAGFAALFEREVCSS